jgi:hypothetical protein
MFTHLSHYEFAAAVSALMFGTVFVCVGIAMTADAITTYFQNRRSS